jgi:hypothetical protein
LKDNPQKFDENDMRKWWRNKIPQKAPFEGFTVVLLIYWLTQDTVTVMILS